MISSRIGGPR